MPSLSNTEFCGHWDEALARAEAVLAALAQEAFDNDHNGWFFLYAARDSVRTARKKGRYMPDLSIQSIDNTGLEVATQHAALDRRVTQLEASLQTMEQRFSSRLAELNMPDSPAWKLPEGVGPLPTNAHARQIATSHDTSL